jgi:hypothetical protein
MAQGRIALLAWTADDIEDPQTLQMVAGTCTNLCRNGNLVSLSKRSFYTFLFIFFCPFFWFLQEALVSQFECGGLLSCD